MHVETAVQCHKKLSSQIDVASEFVEAALAFLNREEATRFIIYLGMKPACKAGGAVRTISPLYTVTSSAQSICRSLWNSLERRRTSTSSWKATTATIDTWEVLRLGFRVFLVHRR